ncbi:MAG: hypothetical protein IJ733_13625 [Lachnospiraceae bacterium]|nr:hypothetical protein [Lachnospiraceae bacterium]
MIDITNKEIKEHLFEGNFGLEREALRVLEDGSFSHTPHPFPEDVHIVRDFCENQTEVNTGVRKSVKEAVEELKEHHTRLSKKLSGYPEREYLWLFSNPPYIKNEADIPVAEFDGEYRRKTLYRDYLSEKYGRYKMTFSGIHFNFSFADALLQKGFEQSAEARFEDYKNKLYLKLAAGLMEYGWILVAATAASPLLDSSFLEKGRMGETVFSGMSSVRCSELGYWNEFVPVLRYESLDAYADSIQNYVEKGFLNSPSELYYPIRLKSEGENDLDTLKEKGVNHIELRMFDLNPLADCGVEERDAVFAHLLILFICAEDDMKITEKDQVRAVQNYKRAAHYDIENTKLVTKEGYALSVRDAALKLLQRMKLFYQDFPESIQEVLGFEREKFIDSSRRYACMVRNRYDGDFVKKGMELAKERQVM